MSHKSSPGTFQQIDGEWWYVKDGERKNRARVLTCVTCGGEVVTHLTSTTRFCGIDCWRKPCKRCGEMFAYRTNATVYCSIECKKGTATCEGCGEAFQISKDAKGFWCSRECYYEATVPTGTRKVQTDGYVLVKVPAETPGARKSHTMKRWMSEHRYVMQQHLGRPLLPKEEVHHRNGVRDDNRLENLELWSRSQPSGQRVEDLLAWAREIVELYG